MDNQTLMIPISRPTHEQRIALLKQLGSNVENAKNQVRVARQEGMNLLGGRGNVGTEDVQKLANEYGGQLDEVLAQAKKEFDK
ncbi:MAG: hypothetical protein TREMPRED_005149 [Tremellales sp. Tagirdzhanova-0007]|nr:MAG: hypothetical protein TREMPRED_005149 [Tremellales sp. Tagirdzhanova-0007]